MATPTTSCEVSQDDRKRHPLEVNGADFYRVSKVQVRHFFRITYSAYGQTCNFFHHFISVLKIFTVYTCTSFDSKRKFSNERFFETFHSDSATFLLVSTALSINYFVFVFFSFEPLTESNVHRSRNILGLVETENQTESNTATVDATNHAHKNCNEPAIFEIPSDGFTREQRQHGWIAVHAVLAIYCFWFLATICDDYFVPCIQSICSCKFLKEKKNICEIFPSLFHSIG